jgi:phage baseplate assembly protein V
MDTLTDIVELSRRLANLVRIGTVAQFDHTNARIRVHTGSLTTTWIPWLTLRAGDTATWSPPSIGEQVLLLAPSGNLEQAVALPALYADAHPAPSTSADEHITVYPDGARIAYNHSTGALTATGVKTALVEAAVSVTLDTPITTVTGQLIVQGLLTYQAGLAGTGGGPGTVITGSIEQTGGTLTSNGVALATHTHGGVQTGGGRTSGPA